jgi:hypothetical protein
LVSTDADSVTTVPGVTEFVLTPPAVTVNVVVELLARACRAAPAKRQKATTT